MYIDFVTLAMDQLVNQAAKIRYMFGGQIGVPMVLRSQGGTGRSGAAQHSQSLEAWMMHTPGLHLAMPSTVTDAYHLLKHSLTLNDPVVFLEHKGLYTLKGTLEPDKALPWGKAEVRRQGGDCTLVSYSRMIHLCMDAAETLSKEGISVEVIDLRTLHPLDMQTVSESVSRTGRAMVVTEDCLTAGVSAELSARIMEEAFDFLEEPVVRLSGEDIPIPVSPQLEQGSVPGVERIMSTVKMLLRR
jgi:pyruvate dehydrogenase E1 component beta subunit